MLLDATIYWGIDMQPGKTILPKKTVGESDAKPERQPVSS
jgi:hypothetical protein